MVGCCWLFLTIAIAHRQVTVICDSFTVSSDPFLKRMVEYFQQHGEYHGASEYSTPEHPIEAHAFDAANNTNKKKKKKHDNESSKSAKQQRQANEQQELEVQLKQFQSNTSQHELVFASSVSAFGRKVIHDFAEANGLEHSSSGVDTERFITIRRKPLLPIDDKVQQRSVESIANQQQDEQLPEQQEAIQQEAIQQEAIQQEAIQQEAMQQEAIQQEAIQQEAIQQEAIQQEAIQQEATQQEAIQQEAIQLPEQQHDEQQVEQQEQQDDEPQQAISTTTTTPSVPTPKCPTPSSTTTNSTKQNTANKKKKQKKAGEKDRNILPAPPKKDDVRLPSGHTVEQAIEALGMYVHEIVL
jgi:hypothetical protein